MVRMLIGICILLVSMQTVHGFEFRNYQAQVLNTPGSGLAEIYDVNPLRSMYRIWMRPSAHQQPEDSLYKLCAHAHGRYYYSGMPAPRTGSQVDQCIRRQIGLSENGWVINWHWIYPNRWYRVHLTNQEVRTYLAMQDGGAVLASLADQVDDLRQRFDALTILTPTELGELMDELGSINDRIDQLGTAPNGLATAAQVAAVADAVQQLTQQVAQRNSTIWVSQTGPGFLDSLWVILVDWWPLVLVILIASILVVLGLGLLRAGRRRRKDDSSDTRHSDSSETEQRVGLLEDRVGGLERGFGEVAESIRELTRAFRMRNNVPSEGPTEPEPGSSRSTSSVTSSFSQEGDCYEHKVTFPR